jgi:hypothetical protein
MLRRVVAMHDAMGYDDKGIVVTKSMSRIGHMRLMKKRKITDARDRAALSAGSGI